MRLSEFTNNTVANWKTIAARNNLANPDLIMPGQVLDIGDGVVMPKGTTYTVKPGDTLSGIAQNIRKGRVPDTASSTDKPGVGGPLGPVAAPVASDDEIKKKIGADQPVPGYKYDASKDQAILDKIQKLDREKQKLPTFLPPMPSKTPKPSKASKTPTDKNVAPTNDQLKLIQKSVYGQESGSGTADTSKPNYAGAIGPMQILPKTFDWVKQLGKIPKDYDINNPEHNKAAGDALLGHYHDKYKGDPKKVYAAYYGGPSAVNKDGSINTHWRDKKNPKAPTVGQYIQQVLGRMKK